MIVQPILLVPEYPKQSGLFLFPPAGYDDYLDDDDLDLIEENLGVKVKRRVSSCDRHLCLLQHLISVPTGPLTQ